MCYCVLTSLFMEVLVDSSVLVYIGDHKRFVVEISWRFVQIEREIKVRYCFVPRLFDCIAVLFAV